MRWAVAAIGSVVLAAGCEQPRTELVARVESEVAWGAGRTVQSVTLTVRRGGPTGPLRSARTTALGMGGERRPLPLLVGIVPTDDTDTPVWIEALGCRDPNGCTAATAVVAQRAVVRFAVGQTQEVPLLLASACVGVTCGSDERCGTGGRCEPATRATVRPFNGIDAGAVADARMDAGRVDAARDVPIVSDLSADITPPVDAPMVDIPAMDIAPPVDLPTMDTSVSCGPLELRCSGACVAALRDPMNCGDCGAVCPTVAGATATCMGGRCGYACDATHADCDDRASNGCESERATDRANCGACGRACNSYGSCVAGACVDCPVVNHQQNYPCGDRCVDFGFDATNCGSCGNVCPMGGQCRAGHCEGSCPAGMRYVPAGLFEMGSLSATNEQPVHVVMMSAFCMDATEVTKAAYRMCPSCGIPNTGLGAGTCVWTISDRETYPINCVNWNQARSYCQWRGGDLPTEAQWEYAARGTDGRIYPWGNQEPRDQINFNATSTVPVASYPTGVSPFGLYDMAGNVSEWTLDWIGPYSPAGATNPTGASTGSLRAYRGGPFYTTYANEVRAAYRYGGTPSYGEPGLGFRCTSVP